MATGIRVLSIMEAAFVTGPAKNLIEFAQQARAPEPDLAPVELFAVSYERGENPPVNAFVETARAAGIPVDIVQERNRFDPAAVTQLKAIVAARRPDIIQTHNVKSHFLMRLSGLWRTHCWIAFQHGYVTTDLKMRCYNQLDRWSLRAPRRVVTVCERFAAGLAARGVPRERIAVRHNSIKPFPPVDPAATAALRKSWPAEAPILLSVGRLSREKGHVDLIRALGLLRRRWPQDRFHLVILGEGVERTRIEAARAEEGLADQVTLAGLQHDVRPYYAAADLAIMPSHSEGSPNALLEAMVAGRAVVATRVGGIPEIVQHEDTAILVESRNAEAMASAIHRLLHNEPERIRLADRARARALTQYSPEAYRRALVRLYEQALGSRIAESQPVS